MEKGLEILLLHAWSNFLLEKVPFSVEVKNEGS
jgi:hypothetical protein